MNQRYLKMKFNTISDISNVFKSSSSICFSGPGKDHSLPGKKGGRQNSSLFTLKRDPKTSKIAIHQNKKEPDQNLLISYLDQLLGIKHSNTYKFQES